MANLCGYRGWGAWGSTMVWDTSFILHFARYGANAYPFVTALDNRYARQHENGFICRESDRNNREVYSGFPVNPPLFAWAEWEWYQNHRRSRSAQPRFSTDRQAIRMVHDLSAPIQWPVLDKRIERSRRLAAECADEVFGFRHILSGAGGEMPGQDLAHQIGRDDMVPFFQAEHDQLGKIVNEHFWDEKHQIYNDLDANGHFITEEKPGVFCKHVHMFWPLIAGIAPPDRVAKMVAELKNPASFNRRNGVPSLSADSRGYTGGPNGTGPILVRRRLAFRTVHGAGRTESLRPGRLRHRAFAEIFLRRRSKSIEPRE